MIYGVVLLAACMFIGSFVRNLLGLLTGLNSDIGGRITGGEKGISAVGMFA